MKRIVTLIVAVLLLTLSASCGCSEQDYPKDAASSPSFTPAGDTDSPTPLSTAALVSTPAATATPAEPTSTPEAIIRKPAVVYKYDENSDVLVEDLIQADLNCDGINETIGFAKLDYPRGTGGNVLPVINGHWCINIVLSEILMVAVFDCDPTDEYIELFVTTYGEIKYSPNTRIMYYNGESLIKRKSIDGAPVLFNTHDGSIISTGVTYMLGDLTYFEEHRLQGNEYITSGYKYISASNETVWTAKQSVVIRYEGNECIINKGDLLYPLLHYFKKANNTVYYVCTFVTSSGAYGTIVESLNKRIFLNENETIRTEELLAQVE